MIITIDRNKVREERFILAPVFYGSVCGCLATYIPSELYAGGST
jgi:hypothetical protein